MGDELAQKWLNAVVPSWLYRWLMPVGWLAALAVSFAGDDQLCSADDPAYCGPDTTFSLALVACLLSLVAWWRMPRLAAVAGLVFSVLDLRYDEVGPARVAWTVYGIACLVLLVALTWSRWRRKALLAAVPRVPVAIKPAAPIGPALAWLGIAVLVLAGVAALLVLRWQVDREDEHVDRAVKQTAVVVTVQDDGDIVLKLSDGSGRTMLAIDDYAVGAQVPVLVDPADSGWLRLQSEPADYTGWYTVAGGAWVLASLLLWRDVLRRRARPRRGWTAGGLPVRIAPESAMDFAIMPRGSSDRLLGFIGLELEDREADGRLLAAFSALDDDEDFVPPAAAQREWSQVLRRYQGDALLVGDLVDGAWPTVVLGDQIFRPVSAFRAPRRTPWSHEEALLLEDLGESEEPVPAVPELAKELPVLPWRVPLERPTWWMKPLLIVALFAVPLAAWVVVSVWNEWWFAIAGVVTCSSGVGFLALVSFMRVVVTATDLTIRSGNFDEVVNWRDVDAVEIGEADGAVTLTSADSWHVISGIPADRVEEVGGVFEALRRQAQYALPQRPARRQLGPGFYVLALHITSCVAVFAVLLLT